MDVEAALEEVAAEIAATEAELGRQQEQLTRLRQEERGLQLFLARHRGERGDTVPSGRPARTDNPWVVLPRTEAILKIMEGTSDPMSPGEIARALTNQGRTGDDSKNVSGALSYLHTHDKVQSLGRGQWVLAAPPLPVTQVHDADHGTPLTEAERIVFSGAVGAMVPRAALVRIPEPNGTSSEEEVVPHE